MDEVSPDLRFRKHEHLRRPEEFRRVYERRCSGSDGRLIMYACRNGLEHSRVGFSVSRKVGNAVVRNRLRRLYREAYRMTKLQLPLGLDLVLIPKGSSEPTLEELKASLCHLAGTLARRLGREDPPS